MTIFPKAKQALQEETTALIEFAQRLGESFQAGTINRAELSLQLAEAYKMASIRMTVIAMGGRENVGRSEWGKLGNTLRRDYAILKKAVYRKDRTDKQQLYDLRQAMANLRPLFSEVDLIGVAKIKKHNVGKRRLDPGADHCIRCPLYSTNGEWVPLSKIVPIGVACPCRGNCRCDVVTRFDPSRNSEGDLIEVIENRHKNEPSLKRIERLGFGRRRRN